MMNPKGKPQPYKETYAQMVHQFSNTYFSVWQPTIWHPKMEKNICFQGVKATHGACISQNQSAWQTTDQTEANTKLDSTTKPVRNQHWEENHQPILGTTKLSNRNKPASTVTTPRINQCRVNQHPNFVTPSSGAMTNVGDKPFQCFNHSNFCNKSKLTITGL